MHLPKHIVVIRLSAMGDVAMSVPVLRVFCATYPEVNLTVVSKPFFRSLFTDIPNLHFLSAEVNGKHKGIRGLWTLATELKKLPLDAVVDLHDVLRTKILRIFFFFFGIKWATIDKGRAAKRALTRLDNKVFKPLKSTHQRYADVFEKIGFPIDLDKAIKAPSLPIPKALQQKFSSPKKWIGIAPFAAHKSKMYPLDLMENVIEALDASEKYELLLFGGGKKEITLLNNLASKYKHTTSIAGKFSFQEELQTISNLDLMLSMDSGNGHLAALFNVPVLTLWGATHPYAGFAPFKQPTENQLLPDLNRFPLLPTSIYGNKEIEGYEYVMRSIPVETVLEKVDKVLA